VNFQAMLLHPHRKAMRKLRDILNDHYSHLDNTAGGGADVS
jgi:V-type H+-transporting ATPase subunit C